MKSQNKNKTLFGIALATSAIVLGFTNLARAASFQGLGDLPGGYITGGKSITYGVSGDGSVVVGWSNSSTSGNEAFRWTQSGGMVGLGYLPGRSFGSIASGASGNGSVVVGWSNTTGNQAFRWTQPGGMVGLGYLPGRGPGLGRGFQTLALGVSNDGSVVVGYDYSPINESQAFRWTQSGGMVGLGYLPGGRFLSRANGVSGDGSVVVGSGDSASASGTEAFRWTPSGGMVSLGDLPGGIFNSEASDVSGDGSVIVGSGTSASGTEAFRWTQSGGMVGLGDLTGGSFSSVALGVSGDGSVVVGYGNSVNGREAFRWTSSGGMRSLQDILTTDFGLNLTGWQLSVASGISADGLTIVGYGGNPSGLEEAWIARLDSTPNPPPKSVPEPSNVFGLGLLGLGLAATKIKGILSKKAKSPTDNPQATDS
jgi:probable HAF family extracellular repeat protein